VREKNGKSAEDVRWGEGRTPSQKRREKFVGGAPFLLALLLRIFYVYKISRLVIIY